MSKYKRIQSEIKSGDWLQEALRKLNVPFEVGEGLHLFGYMGDQRRETAEIVVRRQHVGRAANDLGFHRLPNGSYEVIISDYDSTSRGAELLRQIKQEYADVSVRKMAFARGYTVAGHTVKADGTRQYQLVRR